MQFRYRVFIFIAALSWSLAGYAKSKKDPLTVGTYNYDFWWPQFAEEYLQLIEKSPVHRAVPSGGQPQCLPVFKNVVDKGQMDIRYALGYFDDSQGIDIIYDKKNLGLSPSLDIEVFYVLRAFLTKKCQGSRLLCGFKESGVHTQGRIVLSKKISLYGKEIAVAITLTHASASASFSRNQNELKERQAFLTRQSEENYFGGLGLADVVFYNGHSRNGGGPDFNPPILDSTLHVNYNGYYKIERPGIKRVLSLLKNNPNKDSVIGFFSCYSQSHFYNALLKANPRQRMVLSSDTINYLDSFQASLGYLEGLLKGECGENLAQIAKQTESAKNGFKGFQIR